MPPQIALLNADQALDACPEAFLPLCRVKRMHRRGWADKITPTLYRRRTVKAHLPEEQRTPFEALHYHAWKWDDRLRAFMCKCHELAPREVPGCFFQMPQADQWKIQHRTVTFMPREA